MISTKGGPLILVVRLLLALGWIAVAWASYGAVSTMGFDVAGDVFFGDMTHPWRRQFNIDFLAHLLLVGLWLGSTAQRRWSAPLVGLAAVIGGGLFAFGYLLVRSFGGDGSISYLLLGKLHRPQGN